MPSRRRIYFLAPLFIVLCAVTAGLIGGRVSAANQDAAAIESRETFTKIYAAVEQNFADKVTADKAIYEGAIPGMLRTLDPHSNFFDPKEYKKLREDQSGHYSGIGMLVRGRGTKTIVQYPFGSSPAFKAGLRPGDTILEVNDKKTDSLNTTEIADLLKGDRGTKVQVVIGREGHKDPLTFNIVRDSIPRSSVPFGTWLKPGIAYVNITQFNEDTSRELDDKLKKLGEKDIKGLIVDLRNNPGGLLPECVETSGHFLKKGEVVVSHHGRLASANKSYPTRTDGTGKDYPVVVLVNRNSASCSEIMSGSLQDHDRAWILGEPTFGKGLVQTVYQLPENTAITLTTARYYTPSGRLIQRDYSNISFLDYYTHSNLEQKNANDVKATDSGRIVYGGGGITPDERYTCATFADIAPYCSAPDKFNKFQIEVLRKSELFNFSASYFGGKTDASLPKGWEPDEKVVEQFHDFLLKDKADFTETDFAANHMWIKQELKREMYITAFSIEDSQRVSIDQDPEIQQGITALPKAKALLDTAKKLLVERTAQQPRSVAAAR